MPMLRRAKPVRLPDPALQHPDSGVIKDQAAHLAGQAQMARQLDELRSLATGVQNRATETGIPRVRTAQGKIPEHQLTGLYDPMVNVILQGSKTIHIGGKALHFDPTTYFVLSIGVPATGIVQPANTGEPYLAVALTLDVKLLTSLLLDLPLGFHTESHASARAFEVATMSPELLDAWCRLMRLTRQPAYIPALAPLYEREILIRVLQGPLGWMLREIATPHSATARINRAIRQLRQNVLTPLHLSGLAESAAMSTSAFHRHFKAITGFSPLQFHKQLRLHHARQLIIGDGVGIGIAAHRVGYQSAAQFSREYARQFGLAPSREIESVMRAIRAG